MQFGASDGSIKTESLYKTVRALEGQGISAVKISHFTCTRPAVRTPGQRDHFNLSPKGNYEYQMKHGEDRDNHTNKTIFAHGFQADRFGTLVGLATRFRFEAVGQNLKPTKPYVITTKKIELLKDKPVMILPAP